MRLELHLRLPAETRLLARTRHAVAGYLAEAGADEDAVADVVLAVDEACANAIKHGSSGDPAAAYAVHAEVTSHEVRIMVIDHGPGIGDCTSDVPPDSMAESGRGLNIIRKVMRDVSLTSGDCGSGTVLRMARSFN